MSKVDPYAEFEVKDSDPYAQFEEKKDVIITPPAERKSGGASGSWEAPAEPRWDYKAGAAVEDFMDAHPYATAPVRALQNLGEGAYTGVKNLVGLPGAIYDAATMPGRDKWDQKAAEFGGPLGLITKRLLVEPTIDNAKAWWESAKHNPDRVQAQIDALRAIPLAGPMVADLIEKGVVKGDPFGATGEAMVYSMAPKVASETKALIPGLSTLPILDRLKQFASDVKADLVTKSDTLLTKGLAPSDIKFQRHMDTGLSELKAGEATTGKVTNVPTAQKALDHQTTVNNRMIDAIVKPQRDIVVPGSKQYMIQQQIEAIPKDLKMHDPKKYASLMDHIRNSHPEDYTIGELNTLRSELGKTQSVYYGKDLSGSLTMDAGTRAIDIARGNASRNMFYRALDNYGLGGGEAAAKINGRIGSIIHFQDAFTDALNKSVSERQPLFKRGIRKAKVAVGAELKGVDEHVAKAVARWDKLPEPVQTGVTRRVTGTSGTQQTLIPMGNTPLLQPPHRTSSGIGESGFAAQQAAGQAERAAAPATTRGTQQPLNPFPGPLGQQNFRAGYLEAPEEAYLSEMARRRMWDSGHPVPPSGQLSLEQGMGGDVMKVQQNNPKGQPILSPKEQYEQEMFRRRLWDAGHTAPPSGQMSLEEGMAPRVFGIEETKVKSKGKSSKKMEAPKKSPPSPPGSSLDPYRVK